MRLRNLRSLVGSFAVYSKAMVSSLASLQHAPMNKYERVVLCVGGLVCACGGVHFVPSRT